MTLKRISCIAAVIVVFAFCAWYINVELPRTQLVSQIEDAGGRVEYTTWSLRTLFSGSRVTLVSIPANNVTQIDTSRLLLFPSLAEVGFEDQSIPIQDGRTVVTPIFRFPRKELPLADEAIAFVREYIDKKPEIPIIDLTPAEMAALEASDDPAKWDDLLEATEQKDAPERE